LEETLRAIKTKPVNVAFECSIAGLVDDYSEQIFKFCRRLTFSKEDAEDLFQETFLKAFEQLSKVNASDNPKSFLFSTAVYLWKSKKRMYARRNRIAPTQSIDDEVVSGSDMECSIIEQENIKFVRELVNALPEKFKIPTILYYTIEMDLADIAATLKLPVGTIKSRLYKARKIIEKGLVKAGYGE